MDNQKRIKEICDSMRDLLLTKNRRYGDAALHPLKIFSKNDASNSIKVRIDDKLNRIMNSTEENPRANDICDVIGYCFLLLLSMGVTGEDILGQID